MTSDIIRSFIQARSSQVLASLSMSAGVFFHPCDIDITKMQEPTGKSGLSQVSQVRQPQQRRRRNRNQTSCSLCRYSKVGCDRKRPYCSSCLRRNKGDECHYSTGPPSHRSEVRGDTPLSANRTASQPFQAHTSPDVSGSDNGGNVDHVAHTSDLDSVNTNFQSRWDDILERPVDSIVHGSHTFPSTTSTTASFPFFASMTTPPEQSIAALPVRPICEYLITHYFQHISPFFHILHGPTFQRQYKAFLDSPTETDHAWLALLFLICSITVNIFEEDDRTFRSLSSTLHPDWTIAQVSQYYRRMAMDCLCRDDFLVHFNIGTLEALLLLIYTISHNEGVEQSWTLLGR